MKIDLHTHTRAIKKSEKGGTNRNMPLDELSAKEFIKSRIEKNVGVVAITNHNYFDIEQFNLLVKQNSGILFLPGAEINVVGENGKDEHHCNIIVNNTCAENLHREFEIQKAEEFRMSIDDFLNLGKKYNKDCILLIETSSKGLGFSEKYIDNYIKPFCVENKIIYALETSNENSASIISNDDRLSLAGSDSYFWNDFSSDKLPDLNDDEVEAKPITFKQFIKQLNNKKYLYGKKNQIQYTKINIHPGEIHNKWDKKIELSLKPGLTVFVGPKASGKTVLVNAIVKELSLDTSKKIVCFGSKEIFENAMSYKQIVDTITATLEKEIQNNEFESVFEELKNALTNAMELTFYSMLDNYKQLINFHSEESDKVYSNIESFVSKKFVWTKNEQSGTDNYIKSNKTQMSQLTNTVNLIKDHEDINEMTKLNSIKWVNKAIIEIKEITIKKYNESMKIKMITSFLKKIKDMISAKRDSVSKPESLGIYNYWFARKQLQLKINQMFHSEEFESNSKKLGEVLDSDGKQKKIYIKCVNFIYEKTKYRGLSADGLIVKGASQITNLNSILSNKNNILKSWLENKTSKHIADLLESFNSDDIKAENFVVTYRLFLDDKSKACKPSSGEEQFIAISHILEDYTNDYYVLDEPEKSLDNKLVYDYIVKKINLLKNQNKKILIITHNSNIAINANPDLVVYRHIAGENRCTYIATNSSYILKNDSDNSVTLDWRVVAIQLLEGGKEAMENRKEFYNDGK